MSDIYFSDDKGNKKKKISRERIVNDEERTPKGELLSGRNSISQGENKDRLESEYIKSDYVPDSFAPYNFKDFDFEKKSEPSALRREVKNTNVNNHKASPQKSREPSGKPVSSFKNEDFEPPKERKKKKKHSSWKKRLVAVLLVLVVALGIASVSYAFSALKGINYSERKENKYISSSKLTSSPDVQNILFIGSDGRDEIDGDRSDTMILFSIDKKNKKIKLTSFLRDSYLYIPAKGASYKLNAAYRYGGANMLMDTLEYNFNIKIDNFVKVDFNAFRQLVNLLGGITVDGVTEREAKYMRDVVKIPSVKAGTNKMNGKTALWYCRIRYIDSDFNRTARQRKVVSAIIDKATKTNVITLLDILKKVLPNVTTDIKTDELFLLGVNALFKYLRYDIVQQQIPANGEWADRWVGSQEVVALDLEANKKILKKFLYD